MYGKLFSQMFDGTLATKGPWQALVTFQQLIILADKHGVVDMTAEAIARRTTIPLQIIQNGLQALQEPDPHSRTPTAEGRRITLLSPSRDWGWQIVNYEHYRKLRSADERREYHRQYYHKARKQISTVSTISTDSTHLTEAVSSKQYAEVVEAVRSPKGSRLQLEALPADWKAYCIAERKDLNPEKTFESFRDYWIAVPGAKGLKLDWLATWRNWVKSQRSNGQVPASDWRATNESILAKAKELKIDISGLTTQQACAKIQQRIAQ